MTELSTKMNQILFNRILIGRIIDRSLKMNWITSETTGIKIMTEIMKIKKFTSWSLDFLRIDPSFSLRVPFKSNATTRLGSKCNTRFFPSVCVYIYVYIYIYIYIYIYDVKYHSVLGLTLNCIWCWESSPEECPFITVTRKSTLSRIGCTCSVPICWVSPTFFYTMN